MCRHMLAEHASATAAQQEVEFTREIHAEVRFGVVAIRQELQFTFGETVQQPEEKHAKLHLCSKKTTSHFQPQLHSHLGVNAMAACWQARVPSSYGAQSPTPLTGENTRRLWDLE